MIASLPSPTVGVWHLGPFPLRMYAVCILLGIVVAVWLTGRRLVDRGYEAGQALDVAAYAVPFGIVGGRIYHVITTPDPYWGEGGNPVDALKIW
ncbi:MAG: prolipoprotein diacylglyceryl transferase, partial [Dermatophilaceae bacterium]|nr:prolipoprotein diacylglyceryl transferase [Dermatophilaceae bacterium]